MISLTQASSKNQGGGRDGYELYLNPDQIESIANNPNYGMSSLAARTVIRMKTGAIHYVDELAPDIMRMVIGKR